MNEDIKRVIDELIAEIKETSSYINYVKIKNMLKDDQEIMSMLDEIKSLQKELVKLEHENKDTIDLNNKYVNLLNTLCEIPLYNQYMHYIEELNNMFSYINMNFESITNI